MRTVAVLKISLQEAQQALLALGEHKTHIQVQLDNLNKLSAGTVFAQIQTLAPVVRQFGFWPRCVLFQQGHECFFADFYSRRRPRLA